MTSNEQKIRQMVKDGANLPLVHFLTGMGSRQFRELQAEVGVSSERTYPGSLEPTQDQERQVWEALQMLSKEKAGKLDVDGWAYVYENTSPAVSYPVVWHLVRRWDFDGMLDFLEEA